MAISKLEKDGQVAIMISPGFGAGWSTWADPKDREMAVFDAEMCQAVLDGDLAKVTTLAENKMPGTYTGGGCDLQIRWLPKGTIFEIEEYDGNETLHIIGGREYLVA